MMNENYVYPAIVEEAEGVYEICFPTLDGIMTCADSEAEVITAAQELLSLTLIDLQDQNLPMPDETGFSGELSATQRLIYVHVWLPYFRSRTKEEYVKKTLTIPRWLDLLAQQNNINFSATLTAALRNALHLNDHR